MTELEQQLAILLRDAPGEPPNTLDPDAIRSAPLARRRYRTPLLAAATVVVIAAAYLLLGHPRAPHPSPPVTGDAVAPQTVGRLWNLVNATAAQNGTTIKHAEAVLTTAARADRFLSGTSGSGETTQPTWAVQAETASSVACCARPGARVGATHAPQLRFRFIVMTVRAATFEQTFGGYTVSGKDLAHLGKVVTLHDTGVPTPTPSLAPALVQTNMINETNTVITVLGCPQCGPHGMPLDPHRTMRWNQRQPNAHYSAIIDGKRATCSPPPEPTLGSDIAIAYRITSPGRCDP